MTKKNERKTEMLTVFYFVYDYSRYWFGLKSFENVPEAEKLKVESFEYDTIKEYIKMHDEQKLLPSLDTLIEKYDGWKKRHLICEKIKHFFSRRGD